MTEHLVNKILKKPNLAGRIIAWSMELSKFSIEYRLWVLIKAQILVDFIIELLPFTANHEQEGDWILYVDGSSNGKGSGARVILEWANRIAVK